MRIRTSQKLKNIYNYIFSVEIMKTKTYFLTSGALSITFLKKLAILYVSFQIEKKEKPFLPKLQRANPKDNSRTG